LIINNKQLYFIESFYFEEEWFKYNNVEMTPETMYLRLINMFYEIRIYIELEKQRREALEKFLNRKDFLIYSNAIEMRNKLNEYKLLKRYLIKINN